ncbi:hypothetical protein NUU61_007794 [Penicillium alfredii]|uniref:Uncharacterized protein n=1 Tax=Penicillium alfredii TaxID=1506179 RepID=A0A9W9ER70_9EURO|nr:uncharacterized protein NUU61_007794 [Penicillium alfredii]KAJ5086487.1 hypothetical protein NUU61_007794 [Penicillium alfredii]
MDFLLLLFLVFFAPLLLFIDPSVITETRPAWLAVSACLGSHLRTRLGEFSARPGLDAYGPSYLRTMASTGPSMSEQIELEDMLAEPGTHRHFEED